MGTAFLKIKVLILICYKYNILKTKIGSKDVNFVKCPQCKDAMKTTKVKDIQCTGCGHRFDLKNNKVEI